MSRMLVVCPPLAKQLGFERYGDVVATRTINVDGPLDVRATVRRLDVGTIGSDGTWWWAAAGEDGPTTVAIGAVEGGAVVRAWGPDAERAIDRADRLLGVHRPQPPLFPGTPAGRFLAQSRAVRTGHTGDVFGAVIAAVCGQIVTRREAGTSIRALRSRFGSTAPGPVALRSLPGPDVVASLGYADLHECGIERRRASVLIEAARRHRRLDEIADLPVVDGYRRLMAVRGLGQWSAALVMGRAVGDLDAVPLGDFHLPNTIAWALAGEERGTDERMEELLEPYRPFRGHVVHAVIEAGVHAPRYGPRMPIRTHW
jgi:3-methyladenine DNA glycosylase/8-oxoguanine DNA glycosylase